MGNAFCPPPNENPLHAILLRAVDDLVPPNPTPREIDDLWEYLDINKDDLLGDEEIVAFVKLYLNTQEDVLGNCSRSKRKQLKKQHICPGLNLGDIIATSQKIRNRRGLFTLLDRSPHQVTVIIKKLFGLSPKQRLTHLVFTKKGPLVLFQPWNIKTQKVETVIDKGHFNFDPAHLDDPAILEAFRSTHMHTTSNTSQQQSSLKLIRSTLRKLGKIDNLGIPTQQLDEIELLDRQLLEKPELDDYFAENLANFGTFANGTIVEVYSQTHGRWVLGEVIGAKSDHAVNVRYMDQSKFLNPQDESRFHLIERIVATPYGIGFLERLRHADYFCRVKLDWGVVYCNANQIQTMQVQSMDHEQTKKLLDEANHVHGNLLVKVVRCVGLPKLDIGGACDPFVHVVVPCVNEEEEETLDMEGTDWNEWEDNLTKKHTMFGEISRQTSVISRSQNPMFNKVLDFGQFVNPFGNTKAMNDLRQFRGSVKVYDADQGANELVGVAQFMLPTRNDVYEEYILDLKLHDGTHRGVIVLQTILIRQEVTPTERQRTRDIFSNCYGHPVRRKQKKSKR